MTTFFDLIQTPAVTVPIFVTLTSLGLLVIIAWAVFKTDEGDRALEEAEAERSRRMEARLQHFAATGDLTPPWTPQGNHSALDSTPRVMNTPYADMAAEYGFDTFKHHGRAELILVDTRFELLDVKLRVVTFPVTRLVGIEDKVLRKIVAGARNIVNKRAKRAGIEVIPAKRGPKPHKGGDTHANN